MTGSGLVTQPLLGAGELEHIRGDRRRHPEVHAAPLFGSRATGTHGEHSDMDIALTGNVDPLRAACIAAEFEEVPSPWAISGTPTPWTHPSRRHGLDRQHIGRWPS
jgi:hypothetical protein